MAIKAKNMFSENCWGDFRANLGLTGPRGGRRWTRLVPQYGFRSHRRNPSAGKAFRGHFSF